MSDFKVLDRVSIGLGGRADEVVFEAIVKDSNSPLDNIKVVLRKLVSTQAKRRGMRAIAVLKKLVRRKLIYHSYSMQFHGYISSPSSGRGSFTLAHGYHGSFSLRHWLQQLDRLPTLEANLALDEESVRRVGDDTVGGPAVSPNLPLDEESVRRVGDDTIGGPAVSRQLQITHIDEGSLDWSELLAQSWTFGYRVEAGECAYKPCG
ncbi:hypothetical protein H0E87_026253 [Populus deltoides]|uniref:Uncharacterized protein n=1 Tax=Populus deltoides TaxID=3696 RepID=A0A8T2X4F3_POPDE|nr:hypothetical protein H0E87_026253 [Populus deltoides]